MAQQVSNRSRSSSSGSSSSSASGKEKNVVVVAWYRVKSGAERGSWAQQSFEVDDSIVELLCVLPLQELAEEYFVSRRALLRAMSIHGR